MNAPTRTTPKRYVLNVAQLLKHARPVEHKDLALIPPTTALFEVTEHADRIVGQVIIRERPWEKQERRLHDPPPPESARRRAEDRAAQAAGKRFIEKRAKELNRQRAAEHRAQQIRAEAEREERRKAAARRPPPKKVPTEAEQEAALIGSMRTLMRTHAPRR